jgi:hypothetical protein
MDESRGEGIKIVNKFGMAWIFMEIKSLMLKDMEEPKKFLSALSFSLDYRL